MCGPLGAVLLRGMNSLATFTATLLASVRKAYGLHRASLPSLREPSGAGLQHRTFGQADQTMVVASFEEEQVVGIGALGPAPTRPGDASRQFLRRGSKNPQSRLSANDRLEVG